VFDIIKCIMDIKEYEIDDSIVSVCRAYYDVNVNSVDIRKIYGTKKKIISRLLYLARWFNRYSNNNFNNCFFEPNEVFGSINNILYDSSFKFQNIQMCDEYLINKPYDYKKTNENHVFCNHANKTLGGGIFTFGFCQEEQMILQSSVMFYLFSKHFYNEDPYGLLNTNLELSPLLIKTKIFVNQNNDIGIYAREGLHKIKQNNKILNEFYKKHDHPVNIFMLAKAIPDISKSSYKEYFNDDKLIDWVFKYSVSCYLMTLGILNSNKNIQVIHIHDGNWGCGVYGHNMNTIYVILTLAIRVAIQMMGNKLTKKVQYYYHTYNDKNLSIINDCAYQFIKSVNKLQIKDILNIIRDFHNDDIELWSKKL